MKTILMTGANGFIGSTLSRDLIKDGYRVKGAVRQPSCREKNSAFEEVVIADINASSQWQTHLLDVDVVIHLAARVHVMEETAQNPELLFKEVNLEGTQNLALQAAAAGVQRLIYISTIKVNGECADTIKSRETVNIPNDAYAASKWLAEQALLEVAANTGLEVVIIRPPLVYGPGVKGNFLRLLKLIQKNIPIPLGSVTNKRSMVYVANLCHLIKHCINHPKAAGELFLVSDNIDLSTPELIRLIAAELNQSEKLLPIPVTWLTTCARVLGKEAEIQRLCGSLQVDIDETKQLLSWHPPYSVHQGVRETAQWFLLNQNQDTL